MPSVSARWTIALLAMLAFLSRLPATLASPNHRLVCARHSTTCTQGSHTRHDTRMASSTAAPARNVLGGALEECCSSPRTGFYRDGFCRTGAGDHGLHTVCAVVTDEFLQFSKGRGNDLTAPMAAYGFPGLRHGDRWCLCVARWKEALDAGKAPGVVLAATHEAALGVVSIEELRAHAVL